MNRSAIAICVGVLALPLSAAERFSLKGIGVGDSKESVLAAFTLKCEASDLPGIDERCGGWDQLGGEKALLNVYMRSGKVDGVQVLMKPSDRDELFSQVLAIAVKKYGAETERKNTPSGEYVMWKRPSAQYIIMNMPNGFSIMLNQVGEKSDLTNDL